MEDISEIKIIGKITSDIKLGTSQKGTKWTRFSVASVINGRKNYNSILAFKDVAENFCNKAKLGDRIKLLANCSLSKNVKTNNYDTNLILFKFEILPQEEIDKATNIVTEKPQPQNAEVPTDGDLPF